MSKEKLKFNKINKKLILLCLGIILVVSFVYADIIWSDETRTFFGITSTEPVCIDGENWQNWSENPPGSGIWEEVLVPSANDCYREDGWPTTKCCVYGENACDTTDWPPTATCTALAVNYCDEYTTEPACTNDDFGVGEATINRDYVNPQTGGPLCNSYISYVDASGDSCQVHIFNCRCLWEGGTCVANFTKSNPDCFSDPDPEIVANGSCVVSLKEKIDECDTTGYVTYKSEADWREFGGLIIEDSPVVCEAPAPVKIRCAAKLSFFTIASLIIAIVLIIVIYLIWMKKKVKKIRRTRKK